MLSFPRSFRLTEDEAELFKLVEAVRRVRCPQVELRVAGGWVRDKVRSLPPFLTL